MATSESSEDSVPTKPPEFPSIEIWPRMDDPNQKIHIELSHSRSTTPSRRRQQGLSMDSPMRRSSGEASARLSRKPERHSLSSPTTPREPDSGSHSGRNSRRSSSSHSSEPLQESLRSFAEALNHTTPKESGEGDKVKKTPKNPI